MYDGDGRGVTACDFDVVPVSSRGDCMDSEPPYWRGSATLRDGSVITRRSRPNGAALEARELIEKSVSPEEWATWLNTLSKICRAWNDNWWKDPATRLPIERNRGELLALIHSEISECLEGVRKNLNDDHLPHRKMEEVELADALIRIFDYAGGFGLDIGGAFAEKMKYNSERADHKPENRVADGGKAF